MASKSATIILGIFPDKEAQEKKHPESAITTPHNQYRQAKVPLVSWDRTTRPRDLPAILHAHQAGNVHPSRLLETIKLALVETSSPVPRDREILIKILVAGVLGDEGDTLLNVLLEVSKAGLEHLLLLAVNLAEGQDLLNTVGAELDLGGEEVDALVLVQRGVDKGGLNNTLLALGGAQQGLGHAGTGHGHGQGGGAGTVLGLDDLVATELDALDDLLVGGQVGVGGLGEQGDDGHTGVATDNGDVLVGGVGALELGDEAGGTDDVEGGDTEQALGVVDTTGLEDLGDDGDGGVDGVGDDEDVGVGGGLGGGLGQVADDGGVGVEQVVTGHAGLAGDTGGDEDDLSTLEGIGQAGGGRVVARDGRLGVDVGNVGGNTCKGGKLLALLCCSLPDFRRVKLRQQLGCIITENEIINGQRMLTRSHADIVQGKLSHSRVELEQ